jgi:signal transduction histidine kinase
VTTNSSLDEIALLRRMIVRLSRLVEISVTLNSTLILDDLLQFIVHSAADILDCEAATILLHEENTQQLYFAAATDTGPGEIKEDPVPMDGSIVGTVFREDRPIILNEVSLDAEAFIKVQDYTGLEVRSLIAVPLRIQDEVTGVLESINKRGGYFDEGDLQTLTNIASQAAVAINNARLVSALTKAYDELGKLDKLKSDFIAIASHELRTPLGLILGNAALLKEGVEEEEADYAEAVLSAAMRMRTLIEDMTNLNMLQVGSAQLALERKPLQPIAEAICADIEELIDSKRQSLSLKLAKEPILAMVDVPKLTMAITNILTNASRFTPEGGKLFMTLEHHGREAWFRIKDDGVGIPPDEIELIFDQFYQVEDHLTRHHGGLGLGLPIVKAIAEAHGGRVWVESLGPDQGTTFTLSLPIAS